MPCGVCSCCEALENPQLSPLCLSPQVKGETERRTWLMRRWNMQRGRWMRSNTGNRVQHFNAYLTLLFPHSMHSLHTRGTVAQSLWLPIDGAQFILKTHWPFPGAVHHKVPQTAWCWGWAAEKGTLTCPWARRQREKKKKSRFSMYVRCSREP